MNFVSYKGGDALLGTPEKSRNQVVHRMPTPCGGLEELLERLTLDMNEPREEACGLPPDARCVWELETKRTHTLAEATGKGNDTTTNERGETHRNFTHQPPHHGSADALPADRSRPRDMELPSDVRASPRAFDGERLTA